MASPTSVMVALLLLAPLATLGGDDASAWQIVSYDGPIERAERAFLVRVAGEPADFVPPFGYLVRLSPEASAALEARPAVVGIRAPLPAEKAARELAGGADRVRILAFPDTDRKSLDAFAATLLSAGARSVVTHPGIDATLDMRLGALSLARVLEHPEVRWVERLRDTAELDNARASSVVQSGTNDVWSVHAMGVNGSTQVVAYCDTGLDTDAPQRMLAGRTVHEMFADRTGLLVQNVPEPLHRKVALYYSPIDSTGLRGDLDDDHGHGTHIAGTLAGDAGVWGARDGNDGVAYAARLAVCDIATARGLQVVADYSQYWQPAYDAGARVHSNSWGTTPSDEYTLAARQHDAYAWDHRGFLLLRSMGNDGLDGTMRPEAAAKSALAIGSTVNDATHENVSTFSSRGPAADGRIKPDLVAPGECVTSASIAGPTAYRCSAGTSFSTPVASGAATLVRDFYAKGFYPSGAADASDAFDASSALVRATLVASAQPVAAAAPEGAEGWGRPQLDTVLPAPRLVVDEDVALSTGSMWTTTLDVGEGADLRIVLAWTDHAAAPGASPAIVNDLDLELEAPGGALVLGNADLAAPDRANVFERILAHDLAAGTYTVRVRGWNVPMGPQSFAVVIVAR